ncbi:MAG: DUF2760 domain-containing protein [Planctomyces sp.]|jgi:hypothetical protein
MSRLALAWKVLTSGRFAQEVLTALEAGFAVQRSLPPSEPAQIPEKKTERVAQPAKVVDSSNRSDALTLLATLQREARFLDFFKEPIDAYSDAQVGAAVRDLHRNCGQVLERQFALRPLLTDPENSLVKFDASPDPARIRLLGNATAESRSGRLMHHGWTATRTELPKWTGKDEVAMILAPAELEVG